MRVQEALQMLINAAVEAAECNDCECLRKAAERIREAIRAVREARSDSAYVVRFNVGDVEVRMEPFCELCEDDEAVCDVFKLRH